MLEISVATCSEYGQRASNEDALRVGEADAIRYAVLADGAGGHEGGAIAARRVVDAVEAALASPEAVFVGDCLTQALLAAHLAVQQDQVGTQGRQRMHSTVVALWIDTRGDRALWSHVGDSRLYRLRYGAVDRITADDSVVHRMLELGILTPQQARAHPMKNQLLAAVGMQDTLEPHTLAQPEPLDDGDVFLLCTDGWWGALSERQIITTLTEAATPQDWLEAMRELISAQAALRQDNFSAIAVWVRDPAESTQSMADPDTGGVAPWTLA
jgi:serine/threonine protein phosphatase PrpC